MPVHFASDRECLQWVAATAGKLILRDVTYGWIRNTLELDRVAISDNLRAQAESHAHTGIEAEVQCRWDERGDSGQPAARRTRVFYFRTISRVTLVPTTSRNLLRSW